VDNLAAVDGLSTLSGKQVKAIAALVTEGTLGEAAATAGCSHRSIERWLQDPNFSRELRQARRRVVEAAIGNLQSKMADAVEALHRNLTASRSPGAQVRAASLIIEYGLKGMRELDLEERLAALEEASGDRDGYDW
jgi:hypothetical protein